MPARQRRSPQRSLAAELPASPCSSCSVPTPPRPEPERANPRSTTTARSGRSSPTTASSATDPTPRSAQAELRLDVRDEALAPADSGKPAIVPGKPEASGLVKRIFATKKSLVMPPPESNKTLSDAEKTAPQATGSRRGRRTRPTGRSSPPKRPALPTVKAATWTRNPIDRFILARLEAEGLAPFARGRPADADPPPHARPDRPAAHAGRGRRLPRRPPRRTPTRRLVDRLLASPRLRRAHGRSTGSTPPATPTPTATTSTPAAT